jgi:hypothetical protein
VKTLLFSLYRCKKKSLFFAQQSTATVPVLAIRYIIIATAKSKQNISETTSITATTPVAQHHQNSSATATA